MSDVITASGARVSRAKLRKVVIASVIGNALEWFDFLIYGYFAASIARVFFPASDPFVSMLFATATFAFSYVMRPIGGVLLGMYADRVGRKPALTLMILLTAAATLLIGVTPGFATIGIAAPVLIILARMAQGLAVGGEFASATAMITEYAPANRKMLFGSLQMCAQALAGVLQGLIGFALGMALTPEDLQSWGWRLPFILGALIAPIGFYIRKHIDESPEFVAAKSDRKVVRVPFAELFRNHSTSVLAGFGVVIVGTVSNYGWFVYLPVFVTQHMNLDFGSAMIGTLVCNTLLLGLCPIAGMLADRFGPRRVFLTGVVLFGLTSFPAFHYILAAPSIERLLIGQLVCTIPIGLIWGPSPGFLTSLFPVEVRSTGMSFCYNVGVLLFGGMAQFTLTILGRVTGSDAVLAYYILLAVAISMLLLLTTARRTIAATQLRAA